jgi:hypothetical protein
MTINIISIEELLPRPASMAPASNLLQMVRVAELTAYLDMLIRLDAIPDDYVPGTRILIKSAREAFNMPPIELTRLS